MNERVCVQRPESGHKPPGVKESAGLVRPGRNSKRSLRAEVFHDGGQERVEAGITGAVRSVGDQQWTVNGAERSKASTNEKASRRASAEPRS
jgi:hypothetical protein